MTISVNRRKCVNWSRRGRSLSVVVVLCGTYLIEGVGMSPDSANAQEIIILPSEQVADSKVWDVITQTLLQSGVEEVQFAVVAGRTAEGEEVAVSFGAPGVKEWSQYDVSPFVAVPFREDQSASGVLRSVSADENVIILYFQSPFVLVQCKGNRCKDNDD